MNAAAPSVPSPPGWAVALGLSSVLVVSIVAGAGLATHAMTRLRGESHAPAERLVGRLLPAFELPTLRDGSHRVAADALRGQPFLINAWASWCGACAYEHPAVSRLAASGRVRVVGLNVQDDRGDALRWLARRGDPFWAALFDEDGAVAARLGIAGTPHHLLVDAEGVVRARWRGAMSDARIEREVLPALDALRRADANAGTNMGTHTTTQARASAAALDPRTADGRAMAGEP